MTVRGNALKAGLLTLPLWAVPLKLTANSAPETVSAVMATPANPAIKNVNFDFITQVFANVLSQSYCNVGRGRVTEEICTKGNAPRTLEQPDRSAGLRPGAFQ